MLNEECLVFHTVSLDVFQDVFVLAHCRACSKATYSVGILIVADLVSGSVCLVTMDDAKAASVAKVLDTVALRYRMPRYLIMDSGPQLQSLSENKELLSALYSREIETAVMPQGHQFGNFCERSISGYKSILMSLRGDSNKSIHHQPQTIVELNGKLLLVESIMSFRTILSSSKDNLEPVLTPRKITHPWVTPHEMNQYAQDIFRDVFHPSDIISQLGKARSSGREHLQNTIIRHLQSSAVRYQKPKVGNDSKEKRFSIIPELNDVVLFSNSEEKKTFGIKVQLLEKNQCLVRTTLYGKVVDRALHFRVLYLLFRPSEWNQGFPIERKLPSLEDIERQAVIDLPVSLESS